MIDLPLACNTTTNYNIPLLPSFIISLYLSKMQNVTANSKKKPTNIVLSFVVYLSLTQKSKGTKWKGTSNTHTHNTFTCTCTPCWTDELNMVYYTFSELCSLLWRLKRNTMNMNLFLAAHFNVPTKNTDRMIVDKNSSFYYPEIPGHCRVCMTCKLGGV